MDKKIIKFVRQKDYQFLKELERGSCGETVLLYDEIIREKFVCKKYAPFHEGDKEKLFDNFVQEIKLLHLINHKNIVRVFNYYLYPDQLTGYILMEYVEGFDVEDYLEKYPENLNEVFWQTIEGFAYLENQNILHRDIRPQNLMVTGEGVVKIIDFGFGKQVYDSNDFDKSISLNWWCEPPPEFKNNVYDFKTEVYFVGKLFQKIITEKNIEQFKYKSALNNMCKASPDERIQSFFDIKSGILNDQFTEIEFEDAERESYQDFSKSLFEVVTKIESGAKYFDDTENVLAKLKELHKRVMLEDDVPEPQSVASCFINGEFYFRKRTSFAVWNVKSFIDLLRSCSKEKQNIILSNIHSKLDSLDQYHSEPEFTEEDIPF